MPTSYADPQDAVNRQLLNVLQSDFPLVAEPFKQIGGQLKIDESEVLERVGQLKNNKVIRQVSAIFDTRNLGYRSSLVAARVAGDRADEAAAVISGHPGVSHNYLRSHEYNIWFTIAIPPDSTLGLEKTIEIIKKTACLDEARIMPSIKVYKIGVMLDMVSGGGVSSKGGAESGSFYHASVNNSTVVAEDVPYVQALQEDIPITSRPFDCLAEKYSLNLTEMLIKGAEFLEKKVMRRFAAVLYHRKAGFSENMMGVWVVPEENADRIGRLFSAFKPVSHCYLRPSFPDWPYNMFTMIHASSADNLQGIMADMSKKSGITAYDQLKSLKEYKKVRVKYFSTELAEWESRQV